MSVVLVVENRCWLGVSSELFRVGGFPGVGSESNKSQILRLI